MENLLKTLGLHKLAVSCLMLDFAIHLGMSEADQKSCFIAGDQHDIGKYIVDKEILNKPTALTTDEMNQLKEHVEFGYINTSGLEHDVWRGVADHHENYDGTGYPNYLRGEEISPMGLKLRIVDMYCALRAKRPYKDAYSKNMALEQMEFEKKNFDPNLFKEFKVMLSNQIGDQYFNDKVSIYNVRDFGFDVK